MAEQLNNGTKISVLWQANGAFWIAGIRDEIVLFHPGSV
jgi:hypothetical protein